MIYPISAEMVYTNENANSNVVVEAKNNSGLLYDIKGTKSSEGTKNYINFLFPCGVDIKNIAYTFSDGSVETLDLSKPVDVGLISTTTSSIRTYTMRADVSDLPAFHIIIDESRGSIRDMNRSGNHTVECFGEYNLVTPDGNSVTGTLSMRGRGNATWGLEKKPYQLSLDLQADLLGMGAAKKWNLLANHGDRSLMRSKIVYDMAHEIGLDYAIDSEYVDVFMNGEYLGNYLLTEKVQVNKERVNISKVGFLIEYDTRGQGEPYHFRAPLTEQFVVIKEPDVVTDTMLNEAKDYITDMENAIAAENGINSKGKHYTEYLDIESSIKIYWLNEIVKNGDYGMGSTFYYKDPDSLLFAGPAWDFDIILANATANFGAPTVPKQKNLGSTTGWWLRLVNEQSDENTSVSIQRHLFKHEDYRKASVDMYFSTIREAMFNMLDNIRTQEAILQNSAKLNFMRWNVLEQGHTWQTENRATTYKGEVNFIYDFLSERIEWIDRTMHAEYEDFYGEAYEKPAEPTNDDDPTDTTGQDDTNPEINSDSTSNNIVYALLGVGAVIAVVVVVLLRTLNKR
jgi:Spore coat assembly protein